MRTPGKKIRFWGIICGGFGATPVPDVVSQETLTSENEFTISFHPGSKNTKADSLPSLYLAFTKENTEEHILPPDCFSNINHEQENTPGQRIPSQCPAGI